MESSDSDDCQLYTRAAENVELKRKIMQATLEECKVLPLAADDDLENVSQVVNHDIPTGHVPLKSNHQLIVSSLISDSDEDAPLAELSRNLRSKKSKKPSTSNEAKKSKKVSKQKKTRTRSTANVRDIVVLDDDSEFLTTSLTPINFNSRRPTHRKSTVPDDSFNNISLTSILNQGSDEENLYENDIVMLTVEWQNGETVSRKEFKLRKYQKLETVFEELAKMEGVPTSRVLLMYNFNSVKPMDTPSSLNITFYGALTGSLSATEIKHNQQILENSEAGHKGNVEGSITVKLQLQSLQTLVFKINKHEKMDVLYKKCSEEIKSEESKIKITFDGEYVEPSDMLKDFDVEDGDIFNVYVKK